MRGQILGVDTRTGDGQLTGDDGRRYRFRPEDWAHSGEPAIGLMVDFEPDQSAARSIFPVPGSTLQVRAAPPPATTDRNKFVAAALAFFLGTLGVHRFYVGRTGSGVAMLLLSLTVVGLLVTGLWALVDTLRFLFMSNAEFATRYAR